MLFTKTDALLEDLYEIAKNVHDSAVYFNQYKISSMDTLKTFSETMKEYESKGDKMIHEIIIRINKTFITAIEREDVMELAVKMDDVLDGLETCSSRLYMYDIMEPDETMVRFGQIIEDSSQQILLAMELLKHQKLSDMREYIIRINDLESAGDELVRRSIRDLFHSSTDPIHIMQFKEIYEVLEEVMDHCEDVADAMETVIMSNT
ncbi:DUF47 domain-containing protein [Brevibacillus choshinensis]|uniref:Phosphate transport regulator n=1 Tax=Brevibacillus choshinensis TaxID=54911 RepID=A0ABR5N6F8_BRECH|nr:DUF47 family protein [Brevibacillus choshinensis]KQL46218.1 hypothetical protein AN963_14700 [Brevibacillus choshinensis]MED4584036.1 DUF47 family protein [Brevibacillus choshinensis]MED4755353.1 DUF47 family protein [Brevibacillus choshinensis]MED4783980.1 DUF47 family protein [Brevibacillus choshinensis]